MSRIYTLPATFPFRDRMTNAEICPSLGAFGWFLTADELAAPVRIPYGGWLVIEVTD